MVIFLGQISPGVADWKSRGGAAIAARDPEKAVAAFSRACSLAPNDREACYFLGRALQALDRFEDARRPLEQALASSRGSSQEQARIHRAIALNNVGLSQPEEAEAHFLAAIRFHAGDAAAYEDPRVDYGVFLVRQGRAAEALPILEKAIRARPASARAHAEIGRAQIEEGNLEAAASSLERAVALDPSAWAARLLLGKAYQRLGRFAEAERELTRGRKDWASLNAGSAPP